MKFVVTKQHFGEVDVKLHWESKDKIKKILSWTALVVASGIGVHVKQKHDKNKTEIDPE